MIKIITYIVLLSVYILADNQVFKKYSCDSCHAFGNTKGLASNLKDIGKKRDVVYLREYILNPKSSVMPAFQNISEDELRSLLIYLGARFNKEYSILAQKRYMSQQKLTNRYTKEQIKLYKECNDGVCNSCDVLAYMYDFGFNMKKDKQKAKMLYKKGCK